MIKSVITDNMTFVDALNASLDIAEHVKMPVTFEFGGVEVSIKPLFDNVLLPRAFPQFECQPDEHVINEFERRLGMVQFAQLVKQRDLFMRGNIAAFSDKEFVNEYFRRIENSQEFRDVLAPLIEKKLDGFFAELFG